MQESCAGATRADRSDHILPDQLNGISVHDDSDIDASHVFRDVMVGLR
jgi:hypothetical protein